MEMDTAKQDLILIVDDNPTNIKVLFSFLKESGFKVLVAKDGESTLEKLQEVTPDLILLDVMMPGIDGFETCRQIKACSQTQDIPVIFMTALSDTVDKVKGLKIGAVDYITKPFQQDEVLARMNIHLQLQKLTRQFEIQNEQLKHLTEELEQRVEERTAQLKDSIHQLQEAQIQLIQSEKMSSLGELVAGVAHEINNPVGFIAGNISMAMEYTEDIFEHLKLYQKHFTDPGDEITEHGEDIELEYLMEDLPNMLCSMESGIERIRNISLSLRNFSRSDSNTCTDLNIHEGLESTLMILRHRLKANDQRPEIQINKHYGELPIVHCYAGPLNQVFMNLLANAIDALDEQNENENKSYEDLKDHPNEITLTTKAMGGGKVEVKIADNGPGIPEDKITKIFSPFVTTKPVGKGTGLGLSISHSIVVEKHQGSLKCNSDLGTGTEFVIQVPVKQVGYES
ncbi:MAG: response regulator [Roseofilum sp. Belize BBD 4]|uniref:hybrid sensor histidine kinase/response regulator n=1 Tax=Roseofilum sp. Belize BBD 4 TaxID=2821500 RepID=UPI001B2197CF|nr:response regulator [Roseofilum sp. Belize BBD 4]MBP0034238.1 response regulator [Roseofilum sp. Belize BBD 4]